MCMCVCACACACACACVCLCVCVWCAYLLGRHALMLPGLTLTKGSPSPSGTHRPLVPQAQSANISLTSLHHQPALITDNSTQSTPSATHTTHLCVAYYAIRYTFPLYRATRWDCRSSFSQQLADRVKNIKALPLAIAQYMKCVY